MDVRDLGIIKFYSFFFVTFSFFSFLWWKNIYLFVIYTISMYDCRRLKCSATYKSWLHSCRQPMPDNLSGVVALAWQHQGMQIWGGEADARWKKARSRWWCDVAMERGAGSASTRLRLPRGFLFLLFSLVLRTLNGVGWAVDFLGGVELGELPDKLLVRAG